MFLVKSPVASRGRYLSYALAVSISVFFVAITVFGATTISTNITTDGTLQVAGASTLTGALYASSTLGVTGITTFFSSVGIGTSTPGTTFAVAGAVSVTGTTTASGFFATSSVITPLISVTGAATSSFTGGISTAGLFSSNGLTLTGGSLISTSVASSSFGNGINITAGCFSISGTCVGGGSGGGGWTNASGAIYPTTATDRVGVGGSTTPWGLFSVESVKGTVSATVPILAVGDTGTSTPFLLISGNNGNVGIGSTTPWAQLSINNIAGASVPLFAVATSTQFQNGTTTTVFVIDSVGRVGIGGTTSPSEQLTVTGNISNLAATSAPPVLLATTSVPTSARGLAVSGKYAYVIRDNATVSAPQLFVYDVATRTPALIGSLSIGTTDDSAGAIFATGHYVYARVGDGVRIIDVSVPFRPKPIGRFANSGDGVVVSSIFVQGRYAYIIEDSVLGIYDVSNPESPLRVGVATGGAGSATYVYVSGNYAYVTDNGVGALEIYDVSNPAAVRRISTIATDSSSVVNVYVSGNYAYVGDGGVVPVLIIYDVSNPYSPRKLSSNSTGPAPSSGPTVAVSGRYAYTFSGLGVHGSLDVYNVLNPLNPTRVGGASIFDAATKPVYSLAVNSRYVYLLSDQSNSQLYILDLGGLETTSAIVHSLEAGNLNVRNNLTAHGQLQISGGAHIGSGGILSLGPISVTSTSTATDLTSASFGNRVAIGTSTPVSRLTVWGSGTQNSSLLRLINKASTTLLNILDNGNIGIGTTSPFAKLSIAATSTGSMHLFAVATSSASATSTLLLISGINGNVGIGTSTPEGVLAIDNSTKGVPALLINAAGPGEGAIAIAVSADDTCRDANSAACALNDLAELFSASGPLEAGELAMFDPSDRSYIKKAVVTTVAANPGLLAGIISTSPAIVFEGSVIKTMSGIYKGSADKVPLALAGRVPVRVSLEGGAIRIGDPITVSSVPGIGKRATKSGRIVGYALESFTGATSENGGKVLVFADNSYWHTQEAEDGLEIKDRVTGEIYCLTVQNGNFEKIKGGCAAL